MQYQCKIAKDQVHEGVKSYASGQYHWKYLHKFLEPKKYNKAEFGVLNRFPPSLLEAKAISTVYTNGAVEHGGLGELEGV